MTIWFLIEINNFIFLCFIRIYLKNKKIIFLYFFTQARTSMLVLIGLIWNSIDPLTLYPSLSPPSLIIFLRIRLKMGVPPIHFWLLPFCIYLNWDSFLIFLTIQKIIPFIFLSINNLPSIIYFPTIILCIIIPPFIIFNRTNLKKLLTYASINQTGWIIVLIFQCPSRWLIYIFIYFLSFFILISSIKFHMLNSSWTPVNSTLNKLINMFILINISGLPPFSFFIIKWYAIVLLIIQIKFNVILLIILFRSVIIIYIYINIILKLSLPLRSTSKLSTYLRKAPIPILIKKFITLILILSFIIIMI